MSEAKHHAHDDDAADQRRDALVPTTSSSRSDRGADEDLTQMLQQRLGELERLAALSKEPKDITKKVSKMKQRLETELAAITDAQVAQLRSKAEAFARDLTEMFKSSLRMQRVADQAQSAKTEATEALSKETLLRSKLDLLCKELQKRNLDMKMQLTKQQEEQMKTHQGFQASLSSISDGIKSTSEENESLRAECIRLKEQLVDTLNRLQKSAEMNQKIQEVRDAESKLFESHLHQLEERSKIEMHKSSLLQQQVEDLMKHNEALSSQAHEFQNRYQQTHATLVSSSEAMKKFSKDMAKQQQLYADAEQQNQMLRKKSALAEQCVALLQEEKQLATASAEKKNAVLQTLCKKLQAEKKALVLQLSQFVPEVAAGSGAVAEEVEHEALQVAEGNE